MEVSAISMNRGDLPSGIEPEKRSISFRDTKIYRFIVKLFSCMCRLFHSKSQSPNPSQREIRSLGFHSNCEDLDKIKERIDEIKECSVTMNAIWPGSYDNKRAVKEFIRDQKRVGAEESRQPISEDSKHRYILLLKERFDFTEDDIEEVKDDLTQKAYEATCGILDFFKRDKEKTIKALHYYSQGIWQGFEPELEFSKFVQIQKMINEGALTIQQFSSIYLSHEIEGDNLCIQLTTKKTYESGKKSFSITLQIGLVFDKEGDIRQYTSNLTKKG
jgi:hypothetical protein